MAYEDFTTYTEVDPYNRWSQTTTRNTGSAIIRAEDSYVYKDYTSNFFGDYSHKVDIYVSSLAISSNAQYIVYGVTNTPASFTDMTDGQIVTVGSYLSALRCIRLIDKGNSNEDRYDSLSLSTWYYLTIERSGTSLTCKIYSDSNRTVLLDTLSITCETTQLRYLEVGGSYDFGTGSGGSFLSENLDLGLPEMIISEESATFNEKVKMKLFLEIEESLGITDDFTFTGEVLESESIGLSEDIELDVSLEKIEPGEGASLSEEITIAYHKIKDIDSDFRLALEVAENINQKINIVKEVKENIENKLNTVKHIIETINQKINLVKEVIVGMLNSCDTSFGKREFINCKVNILKQPIYNVQNDFRMIQQWQVPGDKGIQSKGKEYIKLYIGGEEQTDVDVNSISLSKTVNSPHSASFILARPYDTTNKPATDSTVEIKYNNIRIYYGYIISVSPTDNPESIRINCYDKYWIDNKSTVWFNTGHKSEDDNTVTYEKINTAFGALGVYFGNIGNFVPERLGTYGKAKSEVITQLVTECGNFGWFYDVYGYKKLWTAGGGMIVNIAKQQLGKNIKLYQILDQSFTESVDNIINRYKVNMGTKITRKIYRDSGDGVEEKETKMYSAYAMSADPLWSSDLEELASQSESGFGFDYHQPGGGYQDVFRLYKFGGIELGSDEGWSDLAPPIVEIIRGFGTSVFSGASGLDGILTEGFSIDYDKGTLTLNEPFYYFDTDDKGRISQLYSPAIRLHLVKAKYVQQKEDLEIGGLPDGSESIQELSFVTQKIGSYSDTIVKVLNMGNLSKQNGSTVVIKRGSGVSSLLLPKYNDMAYAKDKAYWALSNNAHKKIKGTIKLTLDAVLLYNLNLSKRITIREVTEYPLNIISMNYNIGDFTVTVALEGKHYYKRSVSMPSHGQGMTITSVSGGMAVRRGD